MIDVVSVWDPLVLTVTIVAAATVGLLAIFGISSAYREAVLVVMAAVVAVQAAVMEVVHMILMLNAGVATRLAVDVIVVAVDGVLHSESLLQQA